MEGIVNSRNLPRSVASGRRQYDAIFDATRDTVGPEESIKKRGGLVGFIKRSRKENDKRLQNEENIVTRRALDLPFQSGDHPREDTTVSQSNSRIYGRPRRDEVQRGYANILAINSSSLNVDTTDEEENWIDKLLGLDKPSFQNHAKREQRPDDLVKGIGVPVDSGSKAEDVITIADDSKCDAGCWVEIIIGALFAVILFIIVVLFIGGICASCVGEFRKQKKDKQRENSDLVAQNFEMRTLDAARPSIPHPTTSSQIPDRNSLTHQFPTPSPSGSAARLIAERAAARREASIRPLTPYGVNSTSSSLPSNSGTAQPTVPQCPPPVYEQQEQYVPFRPFTGPEGP